MAARTKGFLGYLKENARIFLKSFTKFRLVHVALIESALVACIILSFVFIAPMLVQKYAEMSVAPGLINQLDTIEPSIAMEQLQKAKDAMVSFFSITLVWFIGLIVIYGLARAGQWVLVARKMPSVSLFIRYVLYAFLYLFFIILWTALTLAVVKQEIYPVFFLVFSLPFLVYLNLVLQPSIARAGALWKGVFHGLKVAFRKLHILFLPLLAVFIIFTAINTAFLAVYDATGARIAVIIYIVLSVFFLAWLKFYSYGLLEAYG